MSKRNRLSRLPYFSLRCWNIESHSQAWQITPVHSHRHMWVLFHSQGSGAYGCSMLADSLHCLPTARVSWSQTWWMGWMYIAWHLPGLISHTRLTAAHQRTYRCLSHLYRMDKVWFAGIHMAKSSSGTRHHKIISSLSLMEASTYPHLLSASLICSRLYTFTDNIVQILQVSEIVFMSALMSHVHAPSGRTWWQFWVYSYGIYTGQRAYLH